MAHKGNKKKTAFVLPIGNTLTIGNVSPLYAQIMEHYEEHGNIEIKSESIEQIDLAGIQLIVQLKQLGDNFNAHFKLKFNKNTHDLLSKCGFEENILT